MNSSEEEVPKTINLDFGIQRKFSFLPEDWAKESFENDHKFIHHQDETTYTYSAVPSRGVEKPITRFCTGSKYLGEWNEIGVAGKGIYKFAHGVIYDGTFNAEGEFHGMGTLVYPNGQRVEGIWKNGKLAPDHSCVIEGGVFMTDQYCKIPDRRFHVEVKDGFGPPGREFLTNEPPPSRPIPEGCYDTGGGYYDPKLRSIVAYKRRESVGPSLEELIAERETKWRSAFSKMMSESITEAVFREVMKGKMAEDGGEVVGIPSPRLEAWIVEHCRKGWDENVGYKPELYEEWTTGAKPKQ
ncbi:MORN repeat-containing protein 5-like [Cylas formicarius]|uniref:MORN repeat-containing protein 5-like n=1 Tax=Cylas formicarius TaxID=197179 RepID=UPI00295898E7|nr:MORN repeat-containing protein 5-like [Cylas formicarius]